MNWITGCQTIFQMTCVVMCQLLFQRFKSHLVNCAKIKSVNVSKTIKKQTFNLDLFDHNDIAKHFYSKSSQKYSNESAKYIYLLKNVHTQMWPIVSSFKYPHFPSFLCVDAGKMYDLSKLMKIFGVLMISCNMYCINPDFTKMSQWTVLNPAFTLHIWVCLFFNHCYFLFWWENVQNYVHARHWKYAMV